MMTSFHIFCQDNSAINDSKKVLIESYPFDTLGSVIQPIFRDAIVAYKLGTGTERDSLLQLISTYNQPYSEVDSAIYYYVKGCQPYFEHDYQAALPYFHKARTIFQKHNRIASSVYTNGYIANIAYISKDVQGAFDQYKAIYEHDSSSVYLKASMCHNLGALLMELDGENMMSDVDSIQAKSIEQIEFYLDKSLTLQRALGNKQSIATTYSVWINIKLTQGKLDEAKAMVDSCIQIATLYDDQARVAFTRIKQSAILEQLRKYDEALDIIQLSIDFFDEVGNFDQMVHALGRKAGTATIMGNHEQAAKIHQEMLEIYKKHLNSELSEAKGRYETEFQTVKKELKIKEQEVEISRRNKWLLLSGTIFFIGLLLFLLFNQRTKRKAEAEKTALILKGKQKEIKTIFDTQENERKRIAKDLHDGIVQQLGGLKLGLQKVFIESNDQQANKLLKVLDDSTNELRELSHQMRPKSLSELGLIPALEDMLENSIGHTSISYEFEHFNMISRPAEDIEITIFRIAQELANNVIKHSQASKVQFQLYTVNNQLIFSAEDDGDGMHLGSNSTGIGLMNISSRLDAINGTVNFESGPEKGTIATVKIPV